MTNSNTTAKKLYKVFEQKYNPDTEDELKSSATKLNISIDEAAHRVDVFMDVNRKTLKGAYKVFVKAIEQAVADGALDKKVAEFAYFADDINDIDFAGKDYFIATDNLNNSFAFGIDDNGDNGYYFWFWTLTEAAEEIADITDAETAEVIPVERFWCEVEIAELSEQDAADIVAHFHGQDGANKFFKMRATELDGSEEDIDGDNVFDYLPALDELNDVDIGDAEDGDNNNDTQSAAEDFVEEYIFIDAAPVNHIVKVKCTCTIINGEELLTQAGTPRIVRSDKYGAEIQFMVNGDIAYYTFDDKNFDRQAEADFFAIMADRGACILDVEPKLCLLDWDDSAIGMDNSDKIFADPAAYAAAVEAAFKAQYPEGKAILKPAC